MKKFLKLVTILTLLIFTTACDLSVEEEFKEDNFKITLTDNFYKQDNLNSTYYYESSNVGVTATLEEFSELTDTGLTKESTLEDYIKAVEYANNETYEIKKGNNEKYLYFDIFALLSKADIQKTVETSIIKKHLRLDTPWFLILKIKKE